MSKVVLITGVTGQDGAYLAEFLLDKGYEVHGVKCRSSLFNTDRIDHLYQDPHEKNRRFILYHGDMTDSSSLARIIKVVQPDEIYNLEAYGICACNGILFNHESPIRGETFVARKITLTLARIKLDLQDCLYLGNLNAKRDGGHARDYDEAQWLMLQQPIPEDIVIASGVQFSVRAFVNAAAQEIGIAISWHGDVVEEKGYTADGKCFVAVDARYFRPTEVETLLGDPAKAKQKLGWVPKITFPQLVAEMMRENLKVAERDELVKQHGYATMDHHE